MGRRRERGFTLVELLMVVAIIGILAAIAIPNLLNAVQRSKQKKSMVNIRNVATAWEAYASDFSKYNAAGINGASVPVPMTDLSGILSPTYIKVIPTKDGWERDLTAYCEFALGDANTATRYVLESPGRDGIFDPTPTPGAFANFDCDIIYANGQFVTYPQGSGN